MNQNFAGATAFIFLLMLLANSTSKEFGICTHAVVLEYFNIFKKFDQIPSSLISTRKGLQIIFYRLICLYFQVRILFLKLSNSSALFLQITYCGTALYAPSIAMQAGMLSTRNGILYNVEKHIFTPFPRLEHYPLGIPGRNPDFKEILEKL